MDKVKEVDFETYKFMLNELKRQKTVLNMIPSENYASEAVIEACGSVLMNKYSEGYPGKRYYQGNEHVDSIEETAIERAKRLFGVVHVNVQPYSGSPANQAVYLATCEPGDIVMGHCLPDGGHLTHGWKVNFSGKHYKAVQYHVKKDGYIDFDEVRAIAKYCKPKLIWCGATAYPRQFPFAEFGKIADEVGAYFAADIAHIAGLVAGGVHPSPAEHAHIITTTTHKTLRGPRGGMVMVTRKGLEKDPDLAKKIDRAVFPGLQGGPHDHTTAAKAVCFREALQPEFRKYAEQVVKNAKVLAESLMEQGIKLVSNGTDTHLLLVDLLDFGVGVGKEVAVALEQAGICCNANSIPEDPSTPFKPSGIRLGTPILTTRGMKEEEMKIVGKWITKIIKERDNEGLLMEIREKVGELCQKFPVYEKVFIETEKTFDGTLGNGPVKKIRYTFMDDVPESTRKELEKYFTDVGGDTFAIANLPSELTGGALARYSRASTGMQLTIVNEFLDEHGKPNQKKGSELMDRILNAFGDESVGELEGSHLGLENISQLLTKSIEDRRIGGSPIEQSTRYVKYDQKDKDGRWRYLRPKEIMSSPFSVEFERVCDMAFEVYSEGIKRLVEYFKKQLPENEFEIGVERAGQKIKVRKSELIGEAEEKAFRNAYNFTVRCAALDVGRCVLPSSTLTHLGVYGNGRYFTNVITFMKNGHLEEERERAEKIERELNKIIPTFIKRNRKIPGAGEKDKNMFMFAKRLFSDVRPEANAVELMEREDYIDEVVASSLYSHTNISLRQIFRELKKMTEREKLRVLELYIGRREARRDRSGRGLEAGYPLTFDLVGGFAEYRDLERHRMLTQQRQLLTTDLGFIVPPEMKEVGLEREVEMVVKAMENLNQNLRKGGLVAASQYATLFNNRIRFMLGMNLREFQHLSELRTQPAGHFSYRSMVMEMARKVSEKFHWANDAFRFVDYSDPGNRITRAKEQSRIAGKNLSKGVDGSFDLD